MSWKNENNKLIKEFKFKDFMSALDFVNKVAKVAEKQGHHPDIYLTWGKVVIEITTHDQGGKVTKKDEQLAVSVDAI